MTKHFQRFSNMAPANIKIMPLQIHHQSNGGHGHDGHKPRKCASSASKRARSPKKFLVFPVSNSNVQCRLGFGAETGEQARLVIGAGLMQQHQHNGHWEGAVSRKKKSRTEETKPHIPVEEENGKDEEKHREEKKLKMMEEDGSEEMKGKEEKKMTEENAKEDKEEMKQQQCITEEGGEETEDDDREEKKQNVEKEPNIQQSEPAVVAVEDLEDKEKEEASNKPDEEEDVSKMKEEEAKVNKEEEEADVKPEVKVTNSARRRPKISSGRKSSSPDPSRFVWQDVPSVAKLAWSSPQPTVRAKMILLGESEVGKTSLVYAYKYGSGLLPCINSTIGAHYSNLELMAPGKVPVHLQLWDTAGQERFRSMVPMYLRSVGVAMLVYDITNRESFERLDYWIREVTRSTLPGQPEPLLLLIGNKTDQHEQKEVDREEGMTKAVQFGAHFMELSAVDIGAVRSIFQTVADQLAERSSKQFEQAEEVNEETKLSEEQEATTIYGDDWTQQQQSSVIRLDRRLLVGDLQEWTRLWGKMQAGAACCSY